ncbi:MAG: FlgD immunoglobulin-like domain containing protein [Bacteroidota bacterium]
MLVKGWNQIGNPFPFNIDWNTIKNENPTAGLNSLWLFESNGYVKKDVLGSWKGAFVYSDQGGKVNFPVTAKTIANGRTAQTVFSLNPDEQIWQLPIRLSHGDVKQESVIGMHPEAQLSKDSFDEITIPRFMDYLEMHTDHPEFSARHFSIDIVPSTHTFSWTFTVSSNLRQDEATLNWDHTALAGSQSRLILLDIQSQALVDMKATGIYPFTWNEGRQFKIIYAREGELLPDVTLLGNAYPNPFNTTVTIPVLLREKQTSLHIHVYDLLGRKVRTIYQADAAAGIRNVEWDGSNDEGSHIENGLYLYQLSGDKGILSPPKRLLKQ